MYLHLMSLECCGIKELHGISNYESAYAVLQDLGELTYRHKETSAGPNGKLVVLDRPFTNFRYVLFSQARTDTVYGTNLAAFIQKHKLGTLVETGTHVNPNTGNPLKAWLWAVDHDATKTWLEHNPK